MSTLTPDEFSYRFRYDSFQGGMIEALLFGVYTSLVLFALYNIVQKKGIKAAYQPLTVLVCLMYGVSVLHLGLSWSHVQQAFVDKAVSKEATLERLIYSSPTNIVMSGVSRGLLMFAGDCIMIWRCWRLYADSLAIIAVPSALATGELAVFVARVATNVRQINAPTSTNLLMSLIVAHLSMTLATTVLVTLMIVYRIIRMGGLRRYSDIVTIIVESSALYACTIIVFMPFVFHPTISAIIPSTVLVFMPGITSTLKIARVSLDRGVEHTFDEKATRTGSPVGHQVSTLRFGGATTGTRDEEARISVDTTGDEGRT